jgi:pyrimidine-nucleoside phosphorylase
MRAVDIIIKKRDHGELTQKEIEYFIRGVTTQEIPDYQISAWTMAVFLNGMTERETTDLTLAMAHSGDLLDLSGVVPLAVDKHSTGGVGDKTSLVVEPIVAACGLPVGKMSGRGLGFSGGTLDKLESIPGYRTNLSREEFLKQLANVGLVLTGQSADLAPADGRLYAIRDVTGTVDSIPLIAASIMSKKIAAGAQAIVLDVKIGLGAFMATLADGQRLANQMVAIGKLSGRKVVALLSDMNQPLGYAIGNALEVKEAIETLQGGGPADFLQHCLEVASQMLLIGGKVGNITAARRMAADAISSRRAWERFRTLVMSQGGDILTIDKPELLPEAKYIKTIKTTRRGHILGIDAREFGETAVGLGAGRERKTDLIDHAVGIVLHVKVGESIEPGQALYSVHANDQARLKTAVSRLEKAIQWSELPVQPLPLFYGIIS